MARWLIIVRRDKPHLYEALREAWVAVPEVEVVVDRRLGEASPIDMERPRGERRVAMTPWELDLWWTAGIRAVFTGDVLGVEPP
jgi:hypothetical protein